MVVKRSSGVSRAIWIPTIWVMIVASRNVSAWVQRGGYVDPSDVYMEGSPLDRNIFLAMIIIGGILLWRRRVEWGRIFRTNPWLFLLFLYGGISIIWSDFPFVSLKRWIKGIGNLVMVLVVLTDPAPFEALKTLIRRAAYVLVPASVLLIVFFPGLGTSYDYSTGVTSVTGVSDSKNGLGYICLVFGAFFFWSLLTIWRSDSELRNRKEILVLTMILLMIGWLFIKARSATSSLCFMIGVLVMLGTKSPRAKKSNRIFSNLAVIGLVAGIILQSTVDLLQALMSTMGRGMTLTGRTDLWKSLFHIGTNPFLGTGYDSFWLGKRAERIWDVYLWQPNQAHNGYLELYLNLGIIGVILLGAAIVSAYRNIGRTFHSDYDSGRLRIAVLVIVVFYNVTEAAFLRMHLVWIMFLLIAMAPGPLPLLRPESATNRATRHPSG